MVILLLMAQGIEIIIDNPRSRNRYVLMIGQIIVGLLIGLGFGYVFIQWPSELSNDDRDMEHVLFAISLAGFGLTLAGALAFAAGKKTFIRLSERGVVAEFQPWKYDEKGMPETSNMAALPLFAPFYERGVKVLNKTWDSIESVEFAPGGVRFSTKCGFTYDISLAKMSFGERKNAVETIVDRARMNLHGHGRDVSIVRELQPSLVGKLTREDH